LLGIADRAGSKAANNAALSALWIISVEKSNGVEPTDACQLYKYSSGFVGRNSAPNASRDNSFRNDRGEQFLGKAKVAGGGWNLTASPPAAGTSAAK
jgi:hypothetical protein